MEKSPEEIRYMQEQLYRLREDCAEAYQVIGVLAELGGFFGHPAVEKALDNLSAASNDQPRPFEDLLPFDPRTVPSEEIDYTKYHKSKPADLRDILDIGQEECAEVIEICLTIIQCSSKIKRFGLDDRRPTIRDSKTNRENLVQEIGDFLAVVDLLQPKIGFTDDDILKAKIIKLEKLKKICGIQQ